MLDFAREETPDPSLLRIGIQFSDQFAVIVGDDQVGPRHTRIESLEHPGELPVIINAGSGNQGMTCSLPVLEYAKEYDSGEEKMYRALALSNLTAIHQKTGIGRLSAYCLPLPCRSSHNRLRPHRERCHPRQENHTSGG